MRRVTVLMPVHNGMPYLPEAVKSMLSQTYRDFILLAIDDASSDGSLDYLRGLHDSRVQVESSAQHLGLARVLNLGLDLCRTEYVARMDGDDISHRKRLEWQIEFMDAHPACGMSGTWLRTFGIRQHRGLLRYPCAASELRVAQLFASPIAHATLILRKGTFDRSGLRYDPAFSRTEDFDLCTRATPHFEVLNLPRCTYYYRRHPGCVTVSNEDEMRRQVREIVRRQLVALDIIPSDGELDLHCRTCLGRGARTGEELAAARAWWCRLREGLPGRPAYDPRAVRRVLGRQWFLFCRNSASLGAPAWKTYRALRKDLAGGSTITEKGMFCAAVASHRLRKGADAGKSAGLVSVILPVHNGRPLLPDALQSILRQTHRNLEVIVVDDGSTDGSGEWVAQREDARIRLVRMETPSGVAGALNAGLAAARGEWVARMDADDISLPRRLEKQVSYLRQHPEVVALGTRVRYFGGPAGMTDLRPVTAPVCMAYLAFGTPFVHPTVMMRRRALTDGGLRYRADYTRSEDYDLWIRLAAMGRLANLPEVLLRYRLHAQSVTTQHGPDMAAQQRSIMSDVLRRRGVAFTEGELDLLYGVVRCERSAEAREMRDAGALLARLVREERADPDAFREAAAVAWLRYSANNGNFGLASWRMYRDAGLQTDVPGARRQEMVFMASCLWHQCRGRGGAAGGYP